LWFLQYLATNEFYSAYRLSMVTPGPALQSLGGRTIHEKFFEFVERDAWDAGKAVVQFIHSP
jgi:hypothetical protein